MSSSVLAFVEKGRIVMVTKAPKERLIQEIENLPEDREPGNREW